MNPAPPVTTTRLPLIARFIGRPGQAELARDTQMTKVPTIPIPPADVCGAGSFPFIVVTRLFDLSLTSLVRSSLRVVDSVRALPAYPFTATIPQKKPRPTTAVSGPPTRLS